MSVLTFGPETQISMSVVFGRIGRGLSTAYMSLQDWNDRRATHRALRGLTDAELKDIGLLRGTIEDIR